MEKTISLPLYTLLVSQPIPHKLRIQVSNNLYLLQAVFEQGVKQNYLYNIFGHIQRIFEHFESPHNSSVNFQAKEMTIFAVGTIGSDTKHLEIAKLKLVSTRELSLMHILKECEKTEDLTAKEIKHFIKCLTQNIQNTLPQIQYKLNQYKECLWQQIKTKESKFQQQLKKYVEEQNQWEQIYQIFEQKEKEITIQFSKQISDINEKILSVNEKMAQNQATVERVQKEVRQNCVQFKQIQSQQGKYLGTMVNGKKHGKGQFVWGPTSEWKGDRYLGDFFNGKKQGNGIYYFANGNKYVGQYLNDSRQGKGQFIWVDGDRYIGDWLDGDKTGTGEYFYASGDRYSGQYYNGCFQGKGEYFFSNGNKMRGIWKKDLKQGNFLFQYQNGVKEQRVYLKGKLVSSKKI